MSSSVVDWVWDINDADLVEVANSSANVPGSRCKIQEFEMWPNGNSRLMYIGSCESARRHLTGWAMRNTNNHNAEILKKSCLGVLVCSKNCLRDGRRILIRPAICDIARKKQLGLPCPNQECDGRVIHLPCKGNGGYPVTHFWRQINKIIFFQAKGAHDHPRPEFKTARKMTNTNGKRAKLTEMGDKTAAACTITEFTSPKLKKSRKHESSKMRKLKSSGKLKLSLDHQQHHHHHQQQPCSDVKPTVMAGGVIAAGGADMPAVCSCPPFECICKMQQSEHEFWNRIQQQAHNANTAFANRMFLRSLSCDTQPLVNPHSESGMITEFYSPQLVSGSVATVPSASASSSLPTHTPGPHAFTCYQDTKAAAGAGTSPHSTGYSDEENLANNRAYFRQNSAPLNVYMNWLHPDYLMRCANSGVQLYAMDDRKAVYQNQVAQYGNNNGSVCGTPSSPLCPVLRYPMHIGGDGADRTAPVTGPYFPPPAGVAIPYC